MWFWLAITLAIIACFLVNYLRGVIYRKSIDSIKWKYNIGNKLIFRQSNCCYDRLVGCEVIERCYGKDFHNRNTPFYKVKAYTESCAIWILAENEFECTAEQFGEFPKYNKIK